MSKPFIRTTPINEVRVIQVVEIKSLIGEGIKDDPIQEITEYYTLDGVLLARKDMSSNLEKGVWL